MWEKPPGFIDSRISVWNLKKINLKWPSEISNFQESPLRFATWLTITVPRELLIARTPKSRHHNQRVCSPQQKILCAATKTWCSQINKLIKFLKCWISNDAPPPKHHPCRPAPISLVNVVQQGWWQLPWHQHLCVSQAGYCPKYWWDKAASTAVTSTVKFVLLYHSGLLYSQTGETGIGCTSDHSKSEPTSLGVTEWDGKKDHRWTQWTVAMDLLSASTLSHRSSLPLLFLYIDTQSWIQLSGGFLSGSLTQLLLYIVVCARLLVGGPQ